VSDLDQQLSEISSPMKLAITTQVANTLQVAWLWLMTKVLKQ
jgi:hypothetical protein